MKDYIGNDLKGGVVEFSKDKQVKTVSVEKLAQLLQKYPDNFEEVKTNNSGKTKTEPKENKTENAPNKAVTKDKPETQKNK